MPHDLSSNPVGHRLGEVADEPSKVEAPPLTEAVAAEPQAKKVGG